MDTAILDNFILISDSEDSNFESKKSQPKKLINRTKSKLKNPKQKNKSATLNTPARPIPSKSSQSSIKNYFKIQTPHEITKSQSPSIQKLIPRNILSLTSSKNENPSSFANDLNTSTIPRLGKSIQNSAVIQRAASSSKKTQIKAVKQKRLPKEVPAYKVVEGTTFGVDAFQFGDIEGVTTYFLTHFHMDHYVGLKKSFSFPLYVSPITARLVERFIGVDRIWIHEHQINVPFHVDDTEIIFLDANHCPGAVMILFRLKNGRCLLHTGDFRACADMEMIPSFWNHHIDCLYLDTTYLTTRGQFVAQMTSIDEAKQSVRTFLGFQQVTGKPLIIVGTYVIGKEKIWISLAETFNLKIWLEPNRRKAAECIFLPNDPILQRFVENKEDATMHVVALGEIAYPLLNEYLSANPTFGRLLAIRPSGWEKPSKAKLKENARISVVGVQYSEHSSYDELKRFVRFLLPSKVISTVPICGKFLSNTKAVPDEWLASEVKPQRHNYQTNIMNFMGKTGS